MIVEMDMYQSIRTYFNEGKSIRWIAKTLGISRQTVRKYCEGNTHPEVRKDYRMSRMQRAPAGKDSL